MDAVIGTLVMCSVQDTDMALRGNNCSLAIVLSNFLT
jgi:hypothetical protein